MTDVDERIDLLLALNDLHERGANTLRIDPDAPLDELRAQVEICQHRFHRENTERKYRSLCEDMLILLCYANKRDITEKQLWEIKALVGQLDFTELLDPCYRRIS